MKSSLAKFISFIGHPLLTIPLFVAVVMFLFEDFTKAILISSIIIGCIFVPLVSWMYTKSKNGTYTNFDVSDRKQRYSLFYFAVPLLLIATVLLFITHQSNVLLVSVIFGLIITLVSQLVNIYVKSSLHVSLNIYLAFLIMPISVYVALIIFLFTIAIGWSRIVLKRHTFREVVFGAVIGMVISLIMDLIENGIRNS
jgi:membrane-associated phospholipid phosphatase